METNYKYIVYCTTNLVNNYIYIGVHKTINPDIFDGYLGCGVYSTQPYTYNHPKTLFQFAVKEFGPNNFRRTILQVCNTDIQASDLERELVNEEFLQRPDVYNMILGGLNAPGDSSKVKVYRYDTEGNYLNEFESLKDAGTSVDRDYTAISNAIRFKGACAGFYWSTDKLTKLDLTNYTKGDPQAKTVYLYKFSGEFEREFKTFTSCGEFIGISTSEVNQAVYGGYSIRGKYYICLVKSDTFDKARKLYTKSRPVYKYNSEGNFLAEYLSQSDAELNNPGVNIDKFIKNKKPDQFGNFWSIRRVENIRTSSRTSKKIYKLNNLGDIVNQYESITQAEKDNGKGVWKVVDRENRTYKGYTYTTVIKDIV